MPQSRTSTHTAHYWESEQADPALRDQFSQWTHEDAQKLLDRLSLEGRNGKIVSMDTRKATVNIGAGYRIDGVTWYVTDIWQENAKTLVRTVSAGGRVHVFDVDAFTTVEVTKRPSTERQRQEAHSIPEDF